MTRSPRRPELRALVDTQRQIQERQQKLNEFGQEQARIRENMKAVSAGTDYYKRLLSGPDQQESQIQDLHKQIESLQKQQQNQQKECWRIIWSIRMWVERAAVVHRGRRGDREKKEKGLESDKGLSLGSWCDRCFVSYFSVTSAPPR